MKGLLLGVCCVAVGEGELQFLMEVLEKMGPRLGMKMTVGEVEKNNLYFWPDGEKSQLR